MIKVIATGCWIHSQNNMSEGGLISQVTQCELDGIPFYVRENVTGIDSFLIASNERQGDKAGRTPSRSRQVLELLTAQPYFDKIKAAVIGADTLRRPVKKSKSFNKDFLKQINFRPMPDNDAETLRPAKFQKLSNDLFWDWYTPSEWVDGKYVAGEKLKWTGYDDRNWWENVITEPGWGERKDSKGRVWKLDPHTNEVSLISSPSK